MSDSLPNPEVSEKLIPGIADLLDEASESQTQPPLVEPIDTTHAPPEPMVSFSHVSIWLGDRRITISIGVATSVPTHDSISVMLRRADGALYAAKDAGRNCVRTHATDEEQVTPRVA